MNALNRPHLTDAQLERVLRPMRVAAGIALVAQKLMCAADGHKPVTFHPRASVSPLLAQGLWYCACGSAAESGTREGPTP